MKSIKEIYTIGHGPSSSHTMGPSKAAELFRKMYPEAEEYRVVLMGSLAMTGKGHMTDEAIIEALSPKKCQVVFDKETRNLPHPNTMDLFAYKEGKQLGELRVLSVGGGAIQVVGENITESPEIYSESTFEEISAYCLSKNISLSKYVELKEGPEIWDYLQKVWNAMRKSIENGLSVSGELPGGLEVQRKAQKLYHSRHIDESQATKENRLVCSYAFAVAEENAGGGIIVTAPTCGSCGVLPSALYYVMEQRGFPEERVLKALAVAGLIGNLIKTNASISGARCGCQAEIGSACSMTAAALGELYEMGIDQIEYAAEVAMEHHLGLTCDPINGLVQIPCIERNAVAAMRAINAVSLANFLTDSSKISFDTVVKTMYETGLDMSRKYRETSEGGLAKNYC